jgi:protein tyrosine phosphatase (PTP) superfamily phosphohydrolase (DUF442 family)
MNDMKRRRPGWRWFARLALAVVALFGAYVGWRWRSGNQGTVVAGQIYRSGQLPAHVLADRIRQQGIRTVINLRGSNPDQAWYRAEKTAVLATGATLVDIPLASDLWLSREQATTLVNVLQTAERPIWIHCEFGSERTGLASALAALLEPGSSLRDAHAQFAPIYLFVPTKDGRVMRSHIESYETWLRSTGQTHSPATAVDWIRNNYTPRSPSRDEWPYDPYPLKVVNRPSEPAEAQWSKQTPISARNAMRRETVEMR